MLVCISTQADARNPAVLLGEIITNVARPRADLKDLFRDEVRGQLAAMDWTRTHEEESFVLSATLMKLDTRADGQRARSTCLVSATLRRQRGGAIHAIAEGKASSEDHNTQANNNELDAMRAAIRVALRGIPNTLP